MGVTVPDEYFRSCAENIWNRFPEVFLALGALDVEKGYLPESSGLWRKRIVDSPEGKLVEIFVPRRSWKKPQVPSPQKSLAPAPQYQVADTHRGPNQTVLAPAGQSAPLSLLNGYHKDRSLDRCSNSNRAQDTDEQEESSSLHSFDLEDELSSFSLSRGPVGSLSLTTDAFSRRATGSISTTLEAPSFNGRHSMVLAAAPAYAGTADEHEPLDEADWLVSRSESANTNAGSPLSGFSSTTFAGGPGGTEIFVRQTSNRANRGREATLVNKLKGLLDVVEGLERSLPSRVAAELSLKTSGQDYHQGLEALGQFQASSQSMSGPWGSMMMRSNDSASSSPRRSTSSSARSSLAERRGKWVQMLDTANLR